MHSHIADAKKKCKKLYCCFVDFKTTPFPGILSRKSMHCGVTGNLLSCLTSMYAQLEDVYNACVLTQDGLTDSFPCTLGAKQSCPTNILLFELYIDQIAAMLRDAKDHVDAPLLLLDQILLATLLFVSDIALFSNRFRPDSQRGYQLDILQLHKFCQMRGLTVNVMKTETHGL